ncbi:MAG: CoA transferase [Dehalococcoidia bacterium]|nr:CoA transferase [Dehalococcoidia bacterium]
MRAIDGRASQQWLRRGTQMADGPLHGVRVLEFSLIVSGPFLGMNLADMGADVIKVEPPEGEVRRHVGVVPNTSKIFQWVNRGKRTIQMDLKTPEALAFIHRIITDIDVVVINYRPGAPKRLGIDYETLSKINPRLIYANITGFGSEGPMSEDGGADMTAIAYSGAMAANGKIDENGAPEGIGGIVLGDTASGLGGAMGVCAALFNREKTGMGQYLETSLVGSAMALEGLTLMHEATTDKVGRAKIIKKYAEVRAAGGTYADLINARKEGVPTARRGANYWSGYNAKDGALVFSANTQAGRVQVRRVLGFEGLGDDDPNVDVNAPDFPEMVKRERAEIERIIRQRTVREWMRDFRAAGAPVAPVLLPEEVADDEQGTHYFQDLVHPVTGPERHVKPIVSFSRTPSFIRAPADMPGDHVDEILRQFGLTDAEMAALREAHAIV